MNRTLARLATIALALPFAVGTVAGGAQAQTYSATVPGCYGAGGGSTIVCNLTVTASVPDPAFSTAYVKVCVGTCHDVPVTYVSTNGATSLCYRYQDGYGVTYGGCSNEWTPSVNIDSYLVEQISCWITSAFCVDL